MQDGDSGPIRLRQPQDERAVVVVDLVESVRLMDLEEEGTVQRWQSFVAGVNGKCLPPYGGRLVKSTGDGMVLVFEDAPAAIQCSQAILRLSDDIGGAPSLRLRVGAHVGRVFIDS